jgi:hypothetical protein
MVIEFAILHELNKCTFVAWVDKVLNETLFFKNIMSEFRATRIWPFNPKAMDQKTKPSDVYISKFVNILDDDVFDGTIDES